MSLLNNALLVVSALILLNVTTFLSFGWDKYCASRGLWRVRESTLLALAVLGGTLGAKVGQHYFLHKTRKEPFCTNLNCIVIAHLLLIPALAYEPSRAAIIGFLTN